MKGLKKKKKKNFIHRDIKSENVLLKKVYKDKDSYDIGYKIADFGFAKRGTSNTKETVNVGSPLYMSP